MDRVKDKVAFVTGAAVGIGRSASILLAREGAQVVVADIVDDKGEQTAAAIQEEGGKATYRHCNVADEGDVRDSLRAASQEYGRVDILVNNAGISGVDKPTHAISVEEWETLMSVNVKGVFLCTKHVIPYMKALGGGSIINLSSIYGIIGAGDIPPYHASKGAVRLMTKNDAVLYATDNIRVNSIHPGFIWTPLVEEMASDNGEDPAAYRKQLDAKHPIGHVGEPDDIGWGVVYLASDEAKFVTGSELVIDGGYTAR